MSDRLASGRIPPSALVLGIAGLVPFVAGAASLWISLPMLAPENGLKLAILYGAIILA